MATLQQIYEEYELTLLDKLLFKKIITQWLTQKHQKLQYLTEKELEMPKEMVDLQIVLGLQSCKTKSDVVQLLSDAREHERHLLLEELK